jgi:hypothetical protein
VRAGHELHDLFGALATQALMFQSSARVTEHTRLLEGAGYRPRSESVKNIINSSRKAVKHREIKLPNMPHYSPKSLLRSLRGKRADLQIKKMQAQLARRAAMHTGISESIIVGNAIPKSGTYLLNSIIKTLELWGNPDIHFLGSNAFLMSETHDSEFVAIDALNGLSSLPNGVSVAAHLHYSPKLSALFEGPRYKHIFQYRDFRDVFVSYATFYAYGKNTGHWERPRQEQKFYQEFFKEHRDRVSYSICKMMENFGFEEYAGWLNDDNTLCVRFEDVYTELVNAEELGFGPSLRALLRYLEVDYLNLHPGMFSKSVLGSGKTESGVIKKVRQFEQIFEEEHYRLLDNDRFKRLMDQFGIPI